MENVKIQSDEENIHIECPHCDMWEQTGIDDPRKRLNVLPIVEWKPDVEGKNELSIHQCTKCKSNFEVEWDYKNPMT